MSFIDKLLSAKVYDLGQPYFVGMPRFPTHPPFLSTLTKHHGDIVLKNGASSAAESLAFGSHVGTHIDALCHFSCGGHFYSNGDMSTLGIATVAPIVRRGVLFDVAEHVGVDALPWDFEVTAAVLDAMDVAVGPGDVALLRTGWGSFWRDHRRFITGGMCEQVVGPGPRVEGARWFSSRGVFAVGSDTVAFEAMPSPEMAVHVHLLVESGIHIIECLNLEELAAAGVRTFGFVASPMKLEGGTGAPVRPLAICGIS